MSAACYILFPDRLVLVSDGCHYTMEEKPRLISETNRKVWKLRSSTGLMWLGTVPTSIDPVLQSVAGLDAKSAIFKIAAGLKAWLAKYPELVALMDNKKPYGVFTFEVFNGYCERYRLAYNVDKFTPYHEEKIKTGAAGAFLPRLTPRFGPYVERHYCLDKRPEDIALKSFKDLVNEYKAKGEPVGGEYYLTTLKPDQ